MSTGFGRNSSRNMADENNDGDEEFRRAFGAHTGVPVWLREEIDRLRSNDPAYKTFFSRKFDPCDDRHFSDLAWELLGRYIARNDHIEDIDLDGIGLTDENMPILFEHLTGSKSLKSMDVTCNWIGANGIQSMVPFLKNSSLTKLKIEANNNINTECFRLLIEGLHDGSIEVLEASECNIEDITVLDDCSLPHLQMLDLSENNIQIIPSLEKYTKLKVLDLGRNNIGREGCKSIAKLLQGQSSNLVCLDLESNNIGDEEAEIIANSLKHNNTLRTLRLKWNDINEDGRRAFLKLLNDVSSINRTYNSNHKLSALRLSDCVGPDAAELDKHIDWAILINRNEPEQDGKVSKDEEYVYFYEQDPELAGRKKVIASQLDSDKRMVLCRLQHIDYCYSSLFADIDPALLPDILSIVGRRHGQNELYRMLVGSVPDLASIVNRKVALSERIAENMAQVAALNAEYMRKAAEHMREHMLNVAAIDAKTLELKRDLESSEAGGGEHHMMANTNPSSAKLCGKKRDRSASSSI